VAATKAQPTAGGFRSVRGREAPPADTEMKREIKVERKMFALCHPRLVKVRTPTNTKSENKSLQKSSRKKLQLVQAASLLSRRNFNPNESGANTHPRA